MGTLEVVRAFYPLRGICQSILVEASDHKIYVLKLARDDQPKSLFNEAFGSQLLRYFGLPVPDWAPLALSEDFIDSQPQIWPLQEGGYLRPAARSYFGSRLVTSRKSAGAYQIIPSSWVPYIANRDDFAGALALDIWANHCDARQAIYTHVWPAPSLRATFIDHGHMFGGSKGEKHARAQVPMALELRLYDGLDIDVLLRRWHKKILRASEESLWSLVADIPQCWQVDRWAEQTISMLLTRVKSLPRLFAEANAILSARNRSFTTRDAIDSIAPRYGCGRHRELLQDW